MKPLSEKQLREKIDEALVPVFKYLCEGKTPFYPESLSEFMVGDEAGKKIVDLILSDRKAWGEHNSKSAEAVNYMISVWDEVIPRWRDTPDHVKQKFIEVERQRNQGEKTDENS